MNEKATHYSFERFFIASSESELIIKNADLNNVSISDTDINNINI